MEYDSCHLNEWKEKKRGVYGFGNRTGSFVAKTIQTLLLTYSIKWFLRSWNTNSVKCGCYDHHEHKKRLILQPCSDAIWLIKEVFSNTKSTDLTALQNENKKSDLFQLKQ